MLLLKLCFRNGLHRLYCLCLLPRLFLDDISAFSLIRANWNWWFSCGCFLKWWYPQNTPKWSLFRRKTHGCWVPPFSETPGSAFWLLDPPLPLPLLRRELPLFASFPYHLDLTGNPREENPKKKMRQRNRKQASTSHKFLVTQSILAKKAGMPMLGRYWSSNLVHQIIKHPCTQQTAPTISKSIDLQPTTSGNILQPMTSDSEVFLGLPVSATFLACCEPKHQAQNCMRRPNSGVEILNQC